MGSHRFRLILTIVAAAVVLGVGSTAVLAVIGPPNPRRLAFNASPPSCAAPELTGTVVDVTLTDMGGMMGPGMMGPGMMGPGGNGPHSPGPPNTGPWQHGYRWPVMGMLRIVLNPATVPAGSVSFRVRNTGMMIHEMTILPLSADRSPGQLPIGTDGQVDESAAVGHAARSCGEGEGDGILPGAIGWTTTTLESGRYEVLCNIAGHYGAGMYTQLDVVAKR